MKKIILCFLSFILITSCSEDSTSEINLNEPLVIKPSQLIKGCQLIIPLMQVGDKWRVFIHPTLAYGIEGRPGIPSNSVLIFDIELLDII